MTTVLSTQGRRQFLVIQYAPRARPHHTQGIFLRTQERQTGGGRAPPHWPRFDVGLKNRRAFSSVLIIRHSCQKSKHLVYFTKICYTMKGGKDAFSLSCETVHGPCTAYISGIRAISICRDVSTHAVAEYISGRPRVEGRRAAYFSFQVELHLHTLHGGGKAGSCVIR